MVALRSIDIWKSSWSGAVVAVVAVAAVVGGVAVVAMVALMVVVAVVAIAIDRSTDRSDVHAINQSSISSM